jgi:hypothetical protein
LRTIVVKENEVLDLGEITGEIPASFIARVEAMLKRDRERELKWFTRQNLPWARVDEDLPSGQ